MSRFTERLVQLAAIVFFLWFGWQTVSQTVVDLIVTKQRLAACEAKLQGN